MSAFKAEIIVLVVCVGGQAGAAVNIWATDKACPAMKPAAVEIGRAPFPQGWTVVVACNDVQWVMLQRKADAQDTRHAFTNVKSRITVVRGAIFLSSPGGRPARRILLHEIGHIQCNCGDEGKAETWAAWYERAGRDGAR